VLDYPGIWDTKGKLLGVGNIQKIAQCKIKVFTAKILYITVYCDDDDDNYDDDDNVL
jgi:hypothetical protein